MKIGHSLKVVLLLLAGCTLLAACSFQRVAPHPYESIDLTPMVKEKGITQKVDNFLIILDASSSMRSMYNGHTKYDLAKALVSHMNQTIPDFQMTAGMRLLGQNAGLKSILAYGLTEYTTKSLGTAVDALTFPGSSTTPMTYAITAGTKDLEPTTGKTAVIIVSDGVDVGQASVEAAEMMREQYRDRLCIYTVQIGDDPAGREVLEQIAATAACGFMAPGDVLKTAHGMAGFVEEVFLSEQPTDSDNDGVADAMDNCPNTPAGVSVDRNGCPLDSDNDGIADYQDKCPGTAAGAPVDDIGCPLDTDGDSVADYLDKCPGTPVGSQVDEYGCELDTDGDGVVDRLDNCPGTPDGVTVDSKGCPKMIKEKVSVTLKVEFDFDKAVIKPGYYPHLKDVAAFLSNYPETQAVLKGYTDDMGTEQYNQNLSLRRAESVRNYLIEKYSIDGARLTAQGFGESEPVATNLTEEGRQQNRRVVATIYTVVTKAE